MTYLHFIDKSLTKEKTKRFRVISNHDCSELWIINWYGGWRTYILETANDGIWSWDCLKEVSDFIQKLLKDKKEKKL